MSGAGLEPARFGRLWSRFSFCSVVSVCHSGSPEGPAGMEPAFWMVIFQDSSLAEPCLLLQKRHWKGFAVSLKLGVQMWQNLVTPGTPRCLLVATAILVRALPHPHQLFVLEFKTPNI